MKRLHIPHSAIVKSPGLLPMFYKARELASALEVPERTLRDWLQTGAPHSRDSQGHVWINGLEFAAWIKDQRQPKRVQKLTDQQAYCMRCHKPVEMVDVVTKPGKGRLLLISGTCPHCGCKINRGGRVPTYGSTQTTWKENNNAK